MSTISKIKLMLAAVIILFVTAAVYISALVLKRQEVLEQVTRYNVAFLLGQAATEHARLEQRLSAYAPAASVTDDEVQLRYDVLVNRTKLLAQGDVLDFLDSNPEQRATVQALEQAIDGGGASRRRDLQPGQCRKGPAAAVGAGREDDQPRFRRQSSGARIASPDDQRQLISLHLQFSALAAGLIVCGIALVTLLRLAQYDADPRASRSARPRGGVARAGAGGDRRQSGQVEIPGDDEPRDPHADECRDRPVVGAARNQARQRAAIISSTPSTNSSNSLLHC